MRYPWRSRTSCFSGSISTRHDEAGLKGFRGSNRPKVRLRSWRGSQAEQFDVAWVERHGSKESGSRLDFLEAIEFGGENEVPDLVRSTTMAERSGDVRREHGFDPSAVDAGNAAKHPPRIVMDELPELFDGDRFDPSKVVRAQRRPEPELIHSEGAIEHQRCAHAQIHNHKRNAPPSIDEREHVAHVPLRVREDEPPVEEPSLSDSALRPHRPPHRRRRAGLVPVLRSEGL